MLRFLGLGSHVKYQLPSVGDVGVVEEEGVELAAVDGGRLDVFVLFREVVDSDGESLSAGEVDFRGREKGASDGVDRFAGTYLVGR